MIKFLHAADFHLDAPFASLSREAAVRRRQEQREAVRRLVTACNEADCDLMLLAGDLLDSDGAWQETIDCLVEQFGACRAQIFLAPGNHDRFLPGCPYDAVQWPDNVHIFTKNRLEAVALPELGCAVWGAAFTQMDCPPLLEGFTVTDPELLNLMVLHGEVRPNSAYNPISEAQIAASGLDYLALGHVHQCSGPLRAGKTTYGWPGCLMGRGFDECGDKGYFLGELDRSGCIVRFVPLPGRRYEIFHVQAGDDAAAAIEAALPPDTAADICRIYLEGEAEPVDERALYRAFAPRFFGLTICDRTVPKVDLWASAGEDTLKGLFLKDLKEQYDRAEDEETRRCIALAARSGLAAMEGREGL